MVSGGDLALRKRALTNAAPSRWLWATPGLFELLHAGTKKDAQSAPATSATIALSLLYRNVAANLGLSNRPPQRVIRAHRSV